MQYEVQAQVQDELNSLGILRQTQLPSSIDWMNDGEKRFMLIMLGAKDSGIARSEVLQEEKQSPDLALRLTAYNMAYWENNRYGKPSHLMLTHQGADMAELLLIIARNKSKSTYSA